MKRLAAACLTLALAACSRGGSNPDPPPPPPVPPSTATPTPASPSTAAAPEQTPTNNPMPPSAVQPSGPHMDVRAANFVIAANLAPSPSGPAQFTLELHGEAGYHVNDQYPVSLELDVRNGTTAKTSLRRADAAELSQAACRFAALVQSTGPGTAVHGRFRFAVCSAENCIPETREFAVAMP